MLCPEPSEEACIDCSSDVFCDVGLGAADMFCNLLDIWINQNGILHLLPLKLHLPVHPLLKKGHWRGFQIVHHGHEAEVSPLGEIGHDLPVMPYPHQV